MDNFQGILHSTLFSVSTAICCCFVIILGTFTPFVSSASNVKIGALFDNATINQDIAEAFQFALQDVNNAQGLFNGTQFELEIVSSGRDPIQGAALAVELMQREVVVVVGPQSSVVAHFVGHIGKAAQVPILSFGATDPNLAEQQYPYFLRVIPSDAIQMEAVAALIAKFGWKVVAAIYTDDDFGANAASALSRSLQQRGSRLEHRSKISSETSAAEIRLQLTGLENTESRVFVLHTEQELGFRILSEANNLNMISSGYVWIVTDLVAVGLLSLNLDPVVKQSLLGLLGTRRYVPPSPPVNNLLIHLKEKHSVDMQSVNTYALYAYDAVQAAAHAISSHLAHGGNLSFTEFHEGFVGGSDFQHMKVLQSGPALRDSLLETAFLGTSGFIQFDEAGDLKNASFEFINLARENARVVAYWANGNNISGSPPQLLDNFTLNTNLTDINTTSMNITWPGGGSDIPRGWVPFKSGRRLKVGVPKKAGYLELVNETTDADNNTRFDGFCIKVFDTAMNHLNYSVAYDFVTVASKVAGKVNPVYDDLTNKIISGELDAAGGDLTITADRLKLVDFTQPYIESGLVVLVARKDRKSNDRWAFLRPYTGTMWGTMLGFTVLVGIVVWILEHNENVELKGPGVMLWFMFSSWFMAHRENTKTFLARFVMILWLFCVLILTSSYTASLTTILTVEELTTGIQGLDTLLKSNDPIGYQTGSFVKKYLMDLKVSEYRLKDFDSLDSYKRALDLGPDRGGVAAIVDELPYVQLLLASDCKRYATAGQVFTKSGWGFAFQRGSAIAEDLSAEILRMSQTGELSELHDFWFKTEECSDSGASVEAQSNQLGIKSFWVLFVIMGTTSIVCVLAFLFLNIKRSTRNSQSPQHSRAE